MTMAHYPVDDYLASHVPVFMGDGMKEQLYDNINTNRWSQTTVFNSEEEFIDWKENHPDRWAVVSINKIEEYDD